MSTLLQDLRYGFCMLRKGTGFTIVAVMALALGIASTTAIFSVVDEILLHPLPYPDSGRIVSVFQKLRSNGAYASASPANYLDWAAQNHSFSYMAASRGFQGNLSGGERPERIRFVVVRRISFRCLASGPYSGAACLPKTRRRVATT